MRQEWKKLSILRSKLDDDFDQLGAKRQFRAGQLSEASLKIVLKKIDGLIRQCNELAEMDTRLPLEVRRSTGIFIGFRPWVFSMIADLRREKRWGRARFSK